jgi:hypothetical protein
MAPFSAHARHRLVVKMSDEVTAAYRAHWSRANPFTGFPFSRTLIDAGLEALSLTVTG